jgi:hypothetical protein
LFPPPPATGVILYIVLSGTPPFDDSTLFEQIRTAKYAFDGEEWEGVSEEAKDLVRRLMTASPATRLKVDQVCQRKAIVMCSFSGLRLCSEL